MLRYSRLTYNRVPAIIYPIDGIHSFRVLHWRKEIHMEQKRTRVTRKTLRERQESSETIVSYVMNNNRYVDKEKSRFWMRSINWAIAPIPSPRALKGKKLNHIILITDQIITEHFSLLLSGWKKCV